MSSLDNSLQYFEEPRVLPRKRKKMSHAWASDSRLYHSLYTYIVGNLIVWLFVHVWHNSYMYGVVATTIYQKFVQYFS